jgi:hypothetical protein
MAVQIPRPALVCQVLSFFRIASGLDPSAARGRAVCFQCGEAWDLAIVICGPAIDFAEHFFNALLSMLASCGVIPN